MDLAAMATWMSLPALDGTLLQLQIPTTTFAGRAGKNRANFPDPDVDGSYSVSAKLSMGVAVLLALSLFAWRFML
jgi:hypothetical protein